MASFLPSESRIDSLGFQDELKNIFRLLENLEFKFPTFFFQCLGVQKIHMGRNFRNGNEIRIAKPIRCEIFICTLSFPQGISSLRI